MSGRKRGDLWNSTRCGCDRGTPACAAAPAVPSDIHPGSASNQDPKKRAMYDFSFHDAMHASPGASARGMNWAPKKRKEGPAYRWKRPATAHQPAHVEYDDPMPVDYRTHLPRVLSRERIAELYPGVPISSHKR